MKFPLSPERSDVLLGGIAPKHIRKFLRDAGGVTPWGENRYRLVLAESVMITVGARWHDWPEGTELTDQGGLELLVAAEELIADGEVPTYARVKVNIPQRVVEEMRSIPRYTDITGWLLQAWYPPTYYSLEHYAITVQGRADLPLLGEFPAKGQYERQFFYADKGLDGQMKYLEVFPTMPGQSWMERAIQSNEHAISLRGEHNDPNEIEVQWRTMRAMEEMMEARQAYEGSKRREFEAQVRDAIAPIFSTTLEGGRIREELAAKCRAKGITLGHVGN